MIFLEDKALNRTGNSVENMALMRRLVNNVIKSFDPERGIASARRAATHDPHYLEGLLGTLFQV